MKYHQLEKQAEIVWMGCVAGRRAVVENDYGKAFDIMDSLKLIAQSARHRSLAAVAMGGAQAIDRLINSNLEISA